MSKILEDELPKILNNSQLNDSANVSQKFDLLCSKMDNIKETNIDMIKLLSNRETDSFTYPIKRDNNKQLTTTTTENDSSISTQNLIVGNKRLENSTIKAAITQKQTAIYVGNLSVTVTEKDLTEYLAGIFSIEEKFIVKKLKVYSGEYNAFRVDARLELEERLLNPDIWISGVTVKKFEFLHSSGQLASKLQNKPSTEIRIDRTFQPRRNFNSRFDRDYSPEPNTSYSLRSNQNYTRQGGTNYNSFRSKRNYAGHHSKRRYDGSRQQRGDFQVSDRREDSYLASPERRNYYYRASPQRRDYFDSDLQRRRRIHNFSTDARPRSRYRS